MPQSTVGNVHFARPLEQMSIGYSPQGMIAETIIPVLPVVNENDLYYIFTREDQFRVVDDLRPDGVRAKQVDAGWTKSGYHVDEHALEVFVTDRERKNADNQLRLELMKVRLAHNLILLKQEARIAAMMAATASYASTNQVNIGAVATNQWNNASFTGSIEAIFDSAKEAIRIQTGGLAATNHVIPKAVAVIVKRDAKIRELVKYTHSNLVEDGDLPSKLWGVNITVPAASYTTSIEGAASPTMVDVWGKHCFTLFKTPTPNVLSPNYGYIFRVQGLQVKTWRDESIDTTWFRPYYLQSEKIVSPYAGYLIQNAIA